MTPKDVKQKAEIAFNNRDKFRPLFQDAYDYTMPTRQGFDHSNQLGQSRTAVSYTHLTLPTTPYV